MSLRFFSLLWILVDEAAFTLSRAIGIVLAADKCLAKDMTLIDIVITFFSAAFNYQDGIRPVTQLNSNATIKSQFVYGSKTNVPDLIVQGSVTYRVVSDHVGSPLYRIKTSSGQVVQ